MSESKNDSLLDKTTSWESLGVSTHIIQALDSCGFPIPSCTQSSALKHILKKPYPNGLFEAPTGTGKTLAFLTAAMERVDKALNAPQVMIVAPTKILATQIYGVAKEFGKECSISVGLCIKEDEMEKDSAATEKTQVIVGRPPNLKNFFAGWTIRNSKGRQKIPSVADAGKVMMVIIDEADVFCKDDYKEDLRTFFSIVPPDAQRLMFSATLEEKETSELTDLFLDKSKPTFSEKFVVYLGNTAQFLVSSASDDEKLNIMKNILSINFARGGGLSIFVFCKTRSEVDEVTAILEKDGYKVAYYHSGLRPKTKRTMFSNFTSGNIHCMICTDGLARGIDISQVFLVINFHPPVKWIDDREDGGDSSFYIHRIGRGGRFGRAGIALTLFTENERKDMEQIKKEVTAKYGIQKQTDELIVELKGDRSDIVKGDIDNLPEDNIYRQIKKRYTELAKLVDKHEKNADSQKTGAVGVDNGANDL